MNCKRLLRLSAAAIGAATLLSPPAGANEIIDQLRAQAAREFGASNLAAGYASMIEFAVADDVSADTFFVGRGSGQLTLDVYKLPIPFTLFRTRNNWRVFGQATFGYLDASQSIESLGPGAANERIKSTWSSYGGAVGVGVNIPVYKRFYVEPYVFIGYARLENRATFFGPVTTGILKPATEGILFDWTIDALTYGGSIAVGYNFRIGKLDVKLRSRYTRMQIRAFHVSGDFGTFSNGLNTVRSDVELIHPLPIRIYGRNLSVVGLFSNTFFFGPDADALGFTYYFEIGAALQYDLRGYNVIAQRLRIGANGVIGRNITGYSIILKLSF